MGGVGDVLAVKIAEIDDVKRLHSAKALIAWARINPPPYEFFSIFTVTSFTLLNKDYLFIKRYLCNLAYNIIQPLK